MIQNVYTQRLKARPLIKDDSKYFSNRFDETLCQYIPEIPIGTDALVWVTEKLDSSECYLCHVIEEKSSGRVVGFVQLFIGDRGTLSNKLAVEIGYFFFPEFWGRGYATELVSSIINGFVEHNNLDQEIVAWVYDGNIRSIKLLESNSFFKAKSKTDSLGNSKSMYVYQSQHLKSLISQT
jgi:RimJ/RimL family protein N-acetyltransferase